MAKGYKLRKKYNVFYCETCAEHPEMSMDEMKAHLETVHGITKLEGTRSMILHVDGPDFYCSKFAWEIGGVKLTQECQNKRSGEDAMYWGD